MPKASLISLLDLMEHGNHIFLLAREKRRKHLSIQLNRLTMWNLGLQYNPLLLKLNHSPTKQTRVYLFKTSLLMSLPTLSLYYFNNIPVFSKYLFFLSFQLPLLISILLTMPQKRSPKPKHLEYLMTVFSMSILPNSAFFSTWQYLYNSLCIYFLF